MRDFPKSINEEQEDKETELIESIIESQRDEAREIDDLIEEAKKGNETAKRNLKLYYHIDFEKLQR